MTTVYATKCSVVPPRVLICLFVSLRLTIKFARDELQYLSVIKLTLKLFFNSKLSACGGRNRVSVHCPFIKRVP